MLGPFRLLWFDQGPRPMAGVRWPTVRGSGHQSEQGRCLLDQLRWRSLPAVENVLGKVYKVKLGRFQPGIDVEAVVGLAQPGQRGFGPLLRMGTSCSGSPVMLLGLGLRREQGTPAGHTRSVLHRGLSH